jgi:hypothetical protein
VRLVLARAGAAAGERCRDIVHCYG